MNKPYIGVVPLVDEDRDSLWMLPGYMDAVTHAGGIPLMLPLTDDPNTLDRLAGLCGGFLLTGVVFGSSLFTIGSSVPLSVTGDQIMLFDRKSGLCITSGSLTF